MKKYRLWSTKIDDYETLEEAEKEAKRRVKRNKNGCKIFKYNPETKTWQVIETITKDNE